MRARRPLSARALLARPRKPDDEGVGVADWASGPPPKPRKRRRRPNVISKRWVVRVEREAAEMRKTADWSEAKPEHLVALYAWCHAEVYGVRPDDLYEGKTFLAARNLAERFAKQQFEGDLGGVVELVLWTWERERDREGWRREQGIDGRRVGWKLQFSPALLIDYRVARRRREGGPR